MHVRRWIKCGWIILFAWWNRSYCFKRKALRHLISFTTLNKFCDPSIKPAKSTVCELFSFVLIIKLIVQRPLRIAGEKYLYGLYFWVWRPDLLRAAAVTIQNIAIFIFCGCGVFRDENRETASRESIRCYHGRSNYYVTAFYGMQCGEILAMGLKYHSVKYTIRSK